MMSFILIKKIQLHMIYYYVLNKENLNLLLLEEEEEKEMGLKMMSIILNLRRK